MHRRDALRFLTAAAAAPWLPAHAAMLTRPAAGGAVLPVIGLGTWQTFDVDEAARAPLAAVLGEFVRLGGRMIDSSPMYGRSEEVAGTLMAAAGSRKSLFVATKVWTTGRERGIAQMESSMKKLGADPIDLMQVHNLQDLDTHMETLNAWKRAGRIRHTGITHYTESAYGEVERALGRHKVDFLQINYSVGERAAEKRLLPLAKERGIAVIANRPFAGGNLLRGLSGKPLPAFAAEIDCTSWAQLLLKFVVSHPAMTVAIPATRRVEHLTDNMAAGRGRMPDEALRLRIAAAVA